MATRPVPTIAEEHQADKKQDHDEADDSEHLHPAWRRLAWPFVGVIVGVG